MVTYTPLPRYEADPPPEYEADLSHILDQEEPFYRLYLYYACHDVSQVPVNLVGERKIVLRTAGQPKSAFIAKDNVSLGACNIPVGMETSNIVLESFKYDKLQYLHQLYTSVEAWNKISFTRDFEGFTVSHMFDRDVVKTIKRRNDGTPSLIVASADEYDMHHRMQQIFYKSPYIKTWFWLHMKFKREDVQSHADSRDWEGSPVPSLVVKEPPIVSRMFKKDWLIDDQSTDPRFKGPSVDLVLKCHSFNIIKEVQRDYMTMQPPNGAPRRNLSVTYVNKEAIESLEYKSGIPIITARYFSYNPNFYCIVHFSKCKN